MNKKMKVTASLFVLTAFVGHDLQSMAGARDFARKLFFSKSAVFTGAAGVVYGTAVMYEGDRANFSYITKLVDSNVNPIVKKQIEDFFKKDGIDIHIKAFNPLQSGRTSAAGTYYKGKNFLVLSERLEGVLNGTFPPEELKDDGRWATQFANSETRTLREMYTREGVWAVLEHEKSHLKNKDSHFIQKKLLPVLSLPAVSLIIKAYQLSGNGILHAAGAAATFAYVLDWVYYEILRQREKRCDLSVSTSKRARALADYFEGLDRLEKESKYTDNDSMYSTFTKPFDRLYKTHPLSSVRVKYLREHAEKLERKEQEIEEIEKMNLDFHISLCDSMSPDFQEKK